MHLPIIHRMYYYVKPFIPRPIQIALRRILVRWKRHYVDNIWPIDRNASTKPTRWHGWPEGKKFALVLTHDVDTWKGHEGCKKLMELEKERGFISSFYFVVKRYEVSTELRNYLIENGFGVGIHGLYHDGKKFFSRKIFNKRAVEINRYLKKWNCRGFSSPSMLHNLEWLHDLDIDYDLSTFDTDPFEPQPDGVKTIFPFLVQNPLSSSCYIELPYTLPQDFTLFVLMREKNIEIWKQKLSWVAEQGGMVLINVHPDYMNFVNEDNGPEEYSVRFYIEFLDYLNSEYKNQFWNALPADVAEFWKRKYSRSFGC